MSLRDRRNPGDDGITLVELLVTVAILAAVLLSMTYASITGLASVKVASAQVNADQLVAATVEGLRAQSWSSVVPSTGTASYALSTSSVTRGGTVYSINGTVSWVDDPCNGSAIVDATRDYLKLDVAVSWQLRTDAQRSSNIVTYRTPSLAEQAPVRTALAC